MEQYSRQERKTTSSKIKSALGRLAEKADAYSSYTDETSRWVVETGEGQAVAAGAKDLEGIDLDEAFKHFPEQLEFVLRQHGIAKPGNTLDVATAQVPNESAFSAYAEEAGQWPGLDAALAEQRAQDRSDPL